MSSILLYSTRKTQKLGRIGALKGGNICRKTSTKLKGGPFEVTKTIFEKVSMPKKAEKRDPLGFFFISVAKHQKY